MSVEVFIGVPGERNPISAVPQFQVCEVIVRHIPQPCGNAAGQPVALEPEELQVGQAPQLRRYLPGQSVVAQVQQFVSALMLLPD